MNYIDFHTHAFPDSIAKRAIAELESGGPCTAHLDGTVGGLIASMDKAGIETSVVASIATRPQQFESILRWSKSIQSPRIVPFASVHPDDPDALDHIAMIADAGIAGIKLHPYYQQFILNDPHMIPIYKQIARSGLLFLCHTGFDLAFDRDRICDPQKIIDVFDQVPDLKLITSHLGAWEDWDEVERYMVGKPIYIEVSYSHGYLAENRIKQILSDHPADYILFGTDSPWMDQSQELAFFKNLGLEQSRLDALLGGNARILLGNL